MRFQASQTLTNSALSERDNHRSGGLEPALHHHTGKARQHWILPQRPSYGDTSSEMQSLLPLRPHIFRFSPLHTRVNEVRQILVFAEDFAFKRGAQFSELNRLQPYLVANYYIIVIDNTVFG